MSFFAKIQRVFFYSIVLPVDIAVLYSRTLKDFWCLALENGNVFVKRFIQPILNELKTRNKNDKITFSMAHILKIDYLRSFNFQFCSSHHSIL